MRLEALGDAGWVVRELNGPAYLVAEYLRQSGLKGLLDAAASYETVGVYSEPGAIAEDDLSRFLDDMGDYQSEAAARTHEIPVCYEMGEDLSEVCAHLQIDPDELKALQSGKQYECYAVGFCPGFGYLGWLPDRLAGIPRKQTPRTRVEPGSVAITGRQTAAYPLLRPGGWSIIGRTPLTLVDVHDGYFPISAGDKVQFAAIGPGEFHALLGTRL